MDNRLNKLHSLINSKDYIEANKLANLLIKEESILDRYLSSTLEYSNSMKKINNEQNCLESINSNSSSDNLKTNNKGNYSLLNNYFDKIYLVNLKKDISINLNTSPDTCSKSLHRENVSCWVSMQLFMAILP